MPPEDIDFSSFFNHRLKERGVSIKKLAEVTGIARGHLENIANGNFKGLPSAPYIRGYVINLGKVLDFDGEAWWTRIKNEGLVRNSGPADALPRNRFVKKPMAKFVWIAVAGVLVLVYLGFQIPKAFGKPMVVIMFPGQGTYVTGSSTLEIQGTAQSTDSLTLNGDNITIAPDGTWQKTVLLQTGMNTFEIVAKKLLGGETDIAKQVLYNPPASGGNSTSSPLNSPVPAGTAPTNATTTP